MNKLIIIILTATALGCAKQGHETNGDKASGQVEAQDHGYHQGTSDEVKNTPKSPPQMAMANIGNSHVHIEYNAPSKRGRTIFGGLVAYDEVWVTGAHNATSINFSEDVEVGGTLIPKGKYALFTIPGRQEWTVIINTNWDQHLADEYDPTEDVVRVKVQPVKLTEPVETLNYEVSSEGSKSGTVAISWDDIMISFEVLDL